MADIFERFRLSLTVRERQQSLFAAFDTNVSREEYIASVFQQVWDFEHRGTQFFYVPRKNASNDPVIVGQIGRPFATRENLPPEQDFADAEHTGWKATVVVVDPRPHSDGQKLAINRDPVVGSPAALIRSFVKHVNGAAEAIAPYHIEVEPIFSSNSFWEFAEAHRDEIAFVQFNFVAPNMFGASDSLNEELRDIRDQEGAQRVTVRFASDDGIRPNTERIRQSVDYATKGAGKILAKSKSGQRYDSTRLTDSVVLDGDGNEPLLVRAARSISRILGLE